MKCTMWMDRVAACAVVLFGACALTWMLSFAPSAYAAEADQAQSGQDLQAGAVEETDSSSQNAAAVDSEAQRIAKMAVVKNGLYNITIACQSKTSLGVKDDSTKAGAKVVPFERDLGSWAQKWVLLQDGKTGYYTVRNLNSRLYLTVAGKVKKGAAVKQAKSSASLAQRWELVKKSGYIVLKSAKSPKLALTFSENKKGVLTATLKAFTGKKAQRVRMRKVDPIDDGHSFIVRSAASLKKALAVKGSSKKANAKIVLDKRTKAKSQKFRFEKVGASWRMQCVQSCLYASASKSAVKQVKNSAGKARKWKVALDLKTATFTIKSVSTGKFLDTKSDKLALRAKSVTKTNAPAKIQRFIFVPTYGFTVFLDAGHGRNASGWGVYDPGAEGNGYEEADLTKDLVKRIQANLKGSDVRVFSGVEYSVPFWQRNGKARSLGCDVVLSVHFDSDGGGGTATMVGTPGASGSSAFNSIIHRKLVSSVGLRDGGTMHRGDITVVNGSVPAVLMEVAFIDNYSSLHTYFNHRSGVAKSLAEGIIEASKNPKLQR